jgi:hypothetical protein
METKASGRVSRKTLSCLTRLSADKVLLSGIIYAACVDNSDTVPKNISSKIQLLIKEGMN